MIPQLPREPIRPESKREGMEQEIWQPSWKCFCCQDTGKVQPHLIRLVIADYEDRHDKSVVCQNPRCEAGEVNRGDPNFDQRFTASICAKLDQFYREDWRRTALNQFALIKVRIQETAAAKNLRKRDRTSDEEMAAQQKLLSVLAEMDDNNCEKRN